MNRFYILLILLFAFSQTSFAQELGYGIRVGLNFNKLRGPSETDAMGSDLESIDFRTGFNVGGSVIFKFTDLVGARTGIFFSQRGMKYKYEGDSFQFFTEDMSGEMVKSEGHRRYRLSVTNSYIEIPLTAYYKFGEKFEISGGFLFGFMTGSTAIGEFDYTGTLPGNPDINFTQELDFNYRKDEPASAADITDDTKLIEFPVVNDMVKFPKTVGAYYMDYPEKDGNYYNPIDVGITAGFSYFLNSGLYLMFSGNYGLIDATNDDFDISRYQSDGLEYIQRDDKDYNVSFQASLGFSF